MKFDFCLLKTHKSKILKMCTENSNSTNLWLIGEPQNNFADSGTINNREVLKVLLYHHLIMKKTISDSAKATAIQVIEISNKKKSTTSTHIKNLIKKIKFLHLKWTNIKKSKNKESKSEIENRSDFDNIMNTEFVYEKASNDCEPSKKIMKVNNSQTRSSEVQLYIEELKNG